MVIDDGHGHRCAHGGDGRELPGQFSRQAQGKEAAARQAGGIDAPVIDAVVVPELTQHGLRETDIVRARQVIHAEPHVPVLLDALRIDDDELVTVGRPVHLRVQHLLGHAHAAAMEIEDDGKRLLWPGLVRRRRVDDVAALFIFMDEAAHLGQRGETASGQYQQADQKFHAVLSLGQWRTQLTQTPVKSR
ncbi:hypothetical protein D3C81_344140 [compost metagenome]